MPKRARTHKLALPSFVLAIGQVSQYAGIFIAGVMRARFFGPSDFGMYTVAFSLATLIIGSVVAGLPILVLRRVSEDNFDSVALRGVLKIFVILSAFTLLFSSIIGFFLLGGWNGFATEFAAGIYVLIGLFGAIGQFIFIGVERPVRAAVYNVLFGSSLPFSAFFGSQMHLGLAGIYLFMSIPCAAFTAIVWYRIPLSQSSQYSQPIRISETLRLSTYSLLGGVYGRVDSIALLIVAGPSVAGAYSAAYRLLGPFSLLSAAISPVAFSHLTNLKSDRQLWNISRRKTQRFLWLTSSALLIPILIAAPELIHFVYGVRFNSSSLSGRILLLSVIPWCLYEIIPTSLVSVGLEKLANFGLLIGTLSDAILVLILGKYFGSVGAAWSWVISEIFMLLIFTIFQHRIINVSKKRSTDLVLGENG